MQDSPLLAHFRCRGATLGEVDGNGPIVALSFSDPLDEQRATRTGVGLFDFSFMSCFEVQGPQAITFLHRLQSRDVSTLSPGQLAYTLLLRSDASVSIDATLWCYSSDHYWLMTGRRSDVEHMRDVAAPYEVKISDRSGSFAVLSLQGPRSAELLYRCGARPLPSYFRFQEATVLAHRCAIARIGYSGELGYELFVEQTRAVALWTALLAEGANLGIRECGFEAADTLRIEAGYILFTRELAPRVTPGELGYCRLVNPRRSRTLSQVDRDRGRHSSRVLVGLLPLQRTGQPTRLPISTPTLVQATLPPGAGALTSAAVSALFRRVVALGFVHPEDRHPGTLVRLGGGAAARVARLPFYDPVRRLPRQLVP